MALVPFSLASPFHEPKALPERLFVLQGVSVVVAQEWKADGKGGTEIGFGAAVYESAICLADHLARNPAVLRSSSSDGCRVLELGGGVGLVGIVCAKFGAAEVVSTDGDAKSVALSSANFAKNEIQAPHRCAELLWGDQAQMHELGLFDLVVASDIVALPYREHFPALLETLRTMLRPGGQFILAFKPRNVVEQAFFHAAKPYLELIETVQGDQLHHDFCDTDIRLLKFRRRPL